METLTGKTLVHYRLVERIGAGGMGEVYRARDTRLERDVAIKVLPRGFASNPERLEAFVREAKILASLNHPNIAAIYGLESFRDEERFLVLELVVGESLAERLRRGALPIPHALTIGIGVCEALEAAHQRGIVHRDVKPGNIMLSERGSVKMLDFGIARRSEGPRDVAAARDPLDPTTVEFATGYGTPEYMSPEQVRDGVQDATTDIFALGCVLYECLTGRRAFHGDTTAAVHLAVLTLEPEWERLPAKTPESIARILKQCLAKDPARRPRDVREIRAALESALALGQEAPAAASRVPTNLPIPLSSFIGRDREIAECGELLERVRLLTLSGMGGAGKTRLALELARAQKLRFPDGVWFADLSSVRDAARLEQTVAQAVGVHEEPGISLLESLAAQLAPRRALLVLDNCEQVAGECAALAERLLSSAPGLKIVATSREPLSLAGEQSYPVPPLATEARQHGEESPPEAVRLFVERARRSLPSFDLDLGKGETVAEICRRLDGIPLAIELAAARVGVLSVTQIREMLNDVFRLLAVGGAAAPRHQTLQAAIEWSYDHLQGEEQRLLRSLSVFAGGASLEGAATVLGPPADEFATLDGLTRLLDKSLIVVERPERGDARYRLLETVRQYAAARLRDAGEEATARARHLRFYVVLAETAASMLLGPQQGLALEQLEREQENVLAAHEWCGAAEEGAELGLRLAGAMRLYWLNRGLFELGLRVSRESLARDGATEARPARALALFAAGSLAYSRGLYEEALARLDESASLSRALGDRSGVARALYMRGTAETSLGQAGAARATLEEVIAIARELGDALRLSVGLNSLAEILRMEGELDEAARLYVEAAKLAQEAGNANTEAVCLLNLAVVESQRGRFGEARASAARVHPIVTDVGSKRLGQALLDLVAGLAAAAGQRAQAGRFYGASEELLERMSARREPAASDFLVPLMIAAREGEGEKAFDEALRQGRRLEYTQAMDEAGAWLRKA